MGNFFKGWRRKIGVVTLVMACLAICFWVRSFHFIDRLSLIFGSSFTAVESKEHGFQWSKFERTNGDWGNLFNIGWNTIPLKGPYNASEIEGLMELPHFYFAGFLFASGEFLENTTQSVWIAPHWSVVLPLTLLSAWLLLSNPRQSNKPVEPASERLS